MTALDRLPTPSDLDLIGSKYNIAPYWLEEIVLLLRAGASDAEALAAIQTPDSGNHTTAQTIQLANGQCRALFAELKELLA